MTRKYTSEGLPVLTGETLKEVGNSLMGKRSFEDWLKEIVKENPAVADTIKIMGQQYTDNRSLAAMDSMILLYKLLKIQGENYKLEDMLARGQAVRG